MQLEKDYVPKPRRDEGPALRRPFSFDCRLAPNRAFSVESRRGTARRVRLVTKQGTRTSATMPTGGHVATGSGSYFHRACNIPLLNDTLGGALDNAAERWPDREAVVVRDQNVRLSFADLRRKVDRLAAGLIALGLRPGDRVGLWSPNRIEWVLRSTPPPRPG